MTPSTYIGSFRRVFDILEAFHVDNIVMQCNTMDALSKIYGQIVLANEKASTCCILRRKKEKCVISSWQGQSSYSIFYTSEEAWMQSPPTAALSAAEWNIFSFQSRTINRKKERKFCPDDVLRPNCKNSQTGGHNEGLRSFASLRERQKSLCSRSPCSGFMAVAALCYNTATNF